MWGYSTTQTLVGLANLLNGPPQDFIGRREYLRLGGIDHDQERVFLLSTTHGPGVKIDTTAFAAAAAGE